MTNDLPPPGWYADPEGHGQRYWDGAAWTSAVSGAPAAGSAPAQPDPARTEPATPATPAPAVPGAPSGPGDIWTHTSPPGRVPLAATGQVGGTTAGDLFDRAKQLPPLVWIGAAVLLVVIVAVLARGAPTHDITGSFTLIDSRFGLDGDGGPCTGSGGYGDISAGRTVTVRDGTGTLVATSSLEPGQREVVSCVFEFTLTDVPSSDYYVFEVGRRGELSYSRDELEDRGWDVAFSLGG